MPIVRFNPLYEINSLHRQMDRLLDDIASWDNGKSTFKPAVELVDHDDNLTLRVSLPGFAKDDLDISVTRDTVKISGKYEHKTENKGNGYYISEFNYDEFERTVNLPVAVKNDRVVANFDDGILTLELPKLEEAKNKVYKVQLGASDEQKTIEAEENTSAN